jgi:hypothetical protein
LPVRNEPQHDHTFATTKTKIRVPLIGFSHSQNNIPFVITNVAVRKLTVNLHKPNLRTFYFERHFAIWLYMKAH